MILEPLLLLILFGTLLVFYDLAVKILVFRMLKNAKDNEREVIIRMFLQRRW
jgi:hypothetical protein